MSSTKPKAALSSTANALSLFDRFNYIFASIFANFVYLIIIEFGHTIELTLLLLELFATWVILDTHIRTFLTELWTVKENAMWYEMLLGILEFISLILVLILFQLFLFIITTSWKLGDLDWLEGSTAIFSIILVSLSMYQIIKLLYDR